MNTNKLWEIRVYSRSFVDRAGFRLVPEACRLRRGMSIREKLGGRFWPRLALVGIVGAAAAVLYAMGRPLWCACGRPFLATADAWSAHTSQHLLDPYSFTHALHGFVFWWALSRWSKGERREWLLPGAVAIEVAWEIFENSPFVIERYRAATAALGYSGDSIPNSLGDIVCCWLGFVVARRVGWRAAVAIFAATEVVLLVWIRDSLLLNVLMLLYPVEAIKQWQVG